MRHTEYAEVSFTALPGSCTGTCCRGPRKSTEGGCILVDIEVLLKKAILLIKLFHGICKCHIDDDSHPKAVHINLLLSKGALLLAYIFTQQSHSS